MDFEKALENIKTIKLTGGIFGKTSLVLIVLTICAAAVSLKVDVWWVPLALMLHPYRHHLLHTKAMPRFRREEPARGNHGWRRATRARTHHPRKKGARYASRPSTYGGP